ncbi:MAG: cyclin CCL1 [Amphiamblys sp. WSBS2006]|nr:MAG: cyclin CCL1 [Amphiamblys sp. WSBS2006]
MSLETQVYTEEEIEHMRESVDRKGVLACRNEVDLQNFYVSKIKEICERNRYSLNTLAVAVRLFKLFFLENTLLEMDGKHTMLAAIFLAAKIDNNHLTVDVLAKRIPNINSSLVVHLEFSVLSQTATRLWYPNILSVLRGNLALLSLQLENPETSAELYRNTKNKIVAAVQTDAILKIPPTQLVLSVLCLEGTEMGIDMDRHVHTIQALSGNNSLAASISACAVSIKKHIEENIPADKAELKETDRKILLYRKQ